MVTFRVVWFLKPTKPNHTGNFAHCKLYNSYLPAADITGFQSLLHIVTSLYFYLYVYLYLQNLYAFSQQTWKLLS